MAVPVIEGFFTESGADGKPHLLGGHCPKCGAFFFPKQYSFCRNPKCQSPELDDVELSTRGHAVVVHRQPVRPAAAVPGAGSVRALRRRRRRARGGEDDRARPGAPAAPTWARCRPVRRWSSSVEDLLREGRRESRVWKWRAVLMRRPVSIEVAILGVGHAPLGQVGPQLRRVRRASRRARRWPTPASTGPTCSSSPAATPCATATPGTSPGVDVRAGARLAGHPDVEQLRRVRVGRAGDRRRAGPRSSPGSATSRSSSAPTPRPRASSRRCRGDRPEDPDWLRFHVLGATNPTYFGLYARRRMEQYGATPEDFATVKVKNSRHGLSNPNARYRKEFTFDEIDGVAGRRRPAAARRHLRDQRRRRRARARERRVRARAATTPGATSASPRSRRSGRRTPTPTSTCPTSRPTPPSARRCRSGRSATRSRTPRTRRPGSGPTT